VKRALTSFLLIFTYVLWGQSDSTMVKTLKIGETVFKCLYDYGAVDDDILFINVHEDEVTSIETTEEYSKSNPVHFLRIHHVGTRRLNFTIKQKSFSVDPNRIFTAKGRRKTLKDGSGFSFRASRQVKFFAKEILSYLDKKSVVVAMHNNTDVNYTIKSYLPGGDESANTTAIHVNPEMDADDFIYTTVPEYFEAFKAKNINVILQNDKKFVNDGSLSVYCALNGINYINIEAQKGHFEEQLRLIHEVMDVIQSK